MRMLVGRAAPARAIARSAASIDSVTVSSSSAFTATIERPFSR